MLRAIIIDDEAAGIEIIKMLALRHTELIKIIASSLKPEEGIEFIEDYKPDVVFLDISMPRVDGFTLLSRLNYRDFKLIFTTAHKEYALEAIKNRAFDYLLKPIDNDDFLRCITEIANTRLHQNKEAPLLQQPIEIQVQDGVLYLKQKEIIRLDASRSYTEFFLDNGKRYLSSKNMGEFEKRLDPAFFYRCHKSHIINLQKVHKFVNSQGLFVQMTDGSMPSVSKDNKAELLRLLKHPG